MKPDSIMIDRKPSGIVTQQSEESVSSVSLDHNPVDMVGLEDYDKAMTNKIYLINNTLDEIGFTWFHMKYFVIAGYGYAADSMIGLAQGTVLLGINKQFKQDYPITTEVTYVGLVAGCIFWGLSADIIGRKLAFNISLLLSAIFGFFVGGSSSFAYYNIFLCFASFCLGGNLAIDATVFLEFLPSSYTFLVTLFACWWSLGQTVGYAVVYAFMIPEKWNCASADYCPSHLNRGWRYVWYVDSAIVLFFALIRLFLKLDETPKYLVINNRDEEAYELLKSVAERYNRPFTLKLEDLKACGRVDKNKFQGDDPSITSFLIASFHNAKSLFNTKKMAYNAVLLFISWGLIGIAYPLYGVFLPLYLSARDADTSASSSEGVYRDALIANAMSFFGPIIGGLLILVPRIGRKGTLFIGGLTTMAFLMAFTAVKTRSQNVAMNTMSYITIYIYYGCLYAYTPEVLPSYCRATGSGLSFVFNRTGGLIVPVIAYFANTSTPAPIYVCAACVGILGFIGLLFPFDPSKQRSV